MHYKPHVFHILILRDYPVVSMSHDPENVLRPRCCSTPLLLCSDPLLLLRPRCCFLLRPRCCFTPTPLLQRTYSDPVVATPLLFYSDPVVVLLRPRCCDPVVATPLLHILILRDYPVVSMSHDPENVLRPRCFTPTPLLRPRCFTPTPLLFVVVLLRPRCCDPVVCLALAGVNSWLCNINLTMT